MLSSADLQYMRDTSEELLPDTCTILSPTNAPDGYGGVEQTWGTVSAAVACRLDHRKTLSQDETIAGAAIQPFSSYMLTIPYDETIEEKYRIVHNSVTYNVVTVNTGQSWKAIKRCSVEKV